MISFTVVAVTNGINETSAERGRRVIHATCAIHAGSRGFCNLVMTKEEGDIVLNPHTTGACVLILDEAEATAMRDALMEWLG